MLLKTFKLVLGAGSALLLVGAVGAAMWVGGQIAYETYYTKPNEALALDYARMRINCEIFHAAYALPVYSNGSALRPEDIAELREMDEARRAAKAAPSAPASPASDAKIEPLSLIEMTKRLDDEIDQKRDKARIEANTLMYEFCGRVN